ARFFVLSEAAVEIPRYVRLGKFDSKAKVAPREERFGTVQKIKRVVPFYLNPVDLSADTDIGVHDLLSLRPAPLIRNAHLDGEFHELPDGTALPAGMRFAARLWRSV
ncbi:type I-D CRISPR-associated protein Cas5/Csc1, partial [bacterium]|nr:type I-D CRISPR-associated protein Cas5/Csc1 [bacterium]